MVPIGTVPNINGLAAILGCKVESLSVKYLGLPLGAQFKSIVIWSSILERMERRLDGWKKRYLSKGQKITFIKNTHSSLPPYFLSSFPIPARVAHCLGKLQRDFLWGGLGDEIKMHLVNCKFASLPIQSGGLKI